MVGGRKTTPQDLPPDGGYGPIQTARVTLRRLLRAPAVAFGVVAATLGGFYVYSLEYKAIRRNEIEKMGARLAVAPMLVAERDRTVLKNLHILRKEEAELMKNHEGWKVGTYYGEPIYLTDDLQKWRDLDFFEYYVHSPEETWSDRLNLNLVL